MEMQLLTYSKIPTYLHNGEFYRTLACDEEDPISVPKKCFKPDDSANSMRDFENLLHVTVYWGLDQIPAGVMQFCFTNKLSVWRDITNEIWNENREMLSDLIYVFEDVDEAFTKAVDVGRDEAVLFLIPVAKDKGFDTINSHATSSMARLGNLVTLQHLCDCGFKFDCSTTAGAAHGGQLDCLKYLYDTGCPWDATLFECGARRGCLACMQFAHENSCDWDDRATLGAATCGYLDCLQYLIQHGCAIHADACEKASEHGHLPCLELLCAHHAPCCARAAAAAAGGGHLDCLQFLYSHHFPWDKYVTKMAACNGRLNVLRYALENGCNTNGDIIRLAAAARKNSLACVKYLLEEQSMYMATDGSVFGAAFKRGDLECISYLVDSGCPYKEYQFAFADPDPNLNHDQWDNQFRSCIAYAVDRGWTVNDELVSYVKRKEMLLCIQYLKDEM